MGVDIRGRSHTLRVNYRTSHQIRRQADRLLPPETSDVDGNTDRRTGTVSVFNGAKPIIRILPAPDEETAVIAEWLKSRGQEGYTPHEMGVHVRSRGQLDRATAAVEMAGYSAVDLAEHAGGVTGNVAVGTMHLAKGLEFRALVVAACDDEVLPSQARIERVGDQAELDEVYTTERHLLYVACTRPRSSPGDRRGTSLRVPRRPTRRALTTADLQSETRERTFKPARHTDRSHRRR